MTPDQAPPDFVARIRAELKTTLRSVQEAATLPWPDLTRATLAFNSISRLLPEAEAAALREASEVEMARLYEAEDRRAGAG